MTREIDIRVGNYRLTNQTPSSRYGTPVLSIDGDDCGPADMLMINGTITTAAQIVADWAADPDRTTDELDAVRLFLRQWPEGPQP